MATRRGGGGGATLAASPETLRLGRIICLLQEDQPLVECLDDPPGACSLLPGCRLRARLRHAETAFLDDMDRASPADIAQAPALDPARGGRPPHLDPAPFAP